MGLRNSFALSFEALAKISAQQERSGTVFLAKRRYPRIEISLAVFVEGMGANCQATSMELGAGGMALVGADHLPVSLPVQVTFTLPPQVVVKLQAVVWWKEGKRIGLRFDLNDSGRKVVERFVDQTIAEHKP